MSRPEAWAVTSRAARSTQPRAYISAYAPAEAASAARPRSSAADEDWRAALATAHSRPARKGMVSGKEPAPAEQAPAHAPENTAAGVVSAARTSRSAASEAASTCG
eukprot:scaffold36285_cov119-Isochrysis_galbana.AAC.12